jgi:hypothetical protein
VLGDGVDWVGISEQKGSWRKLSPGGNPVEIRFLPSGDIETPVAIRIENPDLEVKSEYQIRTIMINPLTSESSWEEGPQELSESLDATVFSY